MKRETETLLHYFEKSKILENNVREQLYKSLLVSEIDMNLALISLRILLEKVLRSYIKKNVPSSDPFNLFDMLNIAEKEQLIDKKIINNLHRARLDGNECAHVGELGGLDFNSTFLCSIQVLEWIEEKDFDYVVGIDVGSTKISGALAKISSSNNIELICEQTIHESARYKEKPNDLVRAISNLIDKLLKHTSQISGVSHEYFTSLGLGLPGQVDVHKEDLIFSPGLQISFFPLKERLMQLLRGKELTKQIREVIVCNDVKCGTIAEILIGNGKAYSNFISIYIGTGVSSGIVVDRKLLEGNDNIAGECGHMIIKYDAEHKCKCGRKGCLESYISGYAIKSRFDELYEKHKENFLKYDQSLEDKDNDPVRSIPIMVNKGCKPAARITDEMAEYLGIGLANLANLYNPEAILLGGGIIKGYYDIVIDKAMKCFDNLTLSRKIEIGEVKFVTQGPMYGACLLPKYYRTVSKAEQKRHA